MSEQAKPHREFWIIHRKSGYDLAFKNPQTNLESLQANNQTKVIEYSAILEERAKSARLLEALKKWKYYKNWQDDYSGISSPHPIAESAIADYSKGEA